MVGGTRSLVPGVPNSRYFCCFSVDNLYLSTCVPGTYQQPWLYIHRMICGLDGG